MPVHSTQPVLPVLNLPGTGWVEDHYTSHAPPQLFCLLIAQVSLRPAGREMAAPPLPPASSS